MKTIADRCRSAISSYLRARDHTQSSTLNLGQFSQNKGVYVSLYNGSRQRGCLGIVERTKDLVSTAENLAILSATKDDRFPPVSLSELPSISVFIWIIIELTPVRSIDTIDFSQFGCFVKGESSQATILPYFGRFYKADLDAIKAEIESKSGITSKQLNEAQVFCLQALCLGDRDITKLRNTIGNETSNHRPQSS